MQSQLRAILCAFFFQLICENKQQRRHLRLLQLRLCGVRQSRPGWRPQGGSTVKLTIRSASPLAVCCKNTREKSKHVRAQSHWSCLTNATTKANYHRRSRADLVRKAVGAATLQMSVKRDSAEVLCSLPCWWCITPHCSFQAFSALK